MFKKKWSRSDIPESVSAGPEEEHSAPNMGTEWSDTSKGKPSDETIRNSLTDVREEIERARRLVRSPENAFTCALGALSTLERRIAALEKKSQETVRSPEASKTAMQQIAALRKQLEDKSPQAVKSSPSKEEEHFLVTPIKGVNEGGRLILGDPKIMSASALKI